MLVVFLCEPGLYSQVADIFDCEQLLDEQLRRIARKTVELLERVGEFPITELLEHLECSSDSARALLLREQGLAAGQLEARLESAVQRFSVLRTVQRAHQAGEAWFSAPQIAPEGIDPEDRDRKLAEIHQSTRAYASISNFAGVRKISKTPV